MNSFVSRFVEMLNQKECIDVLQELSKKKFISKVERGQLMLLSKRVGLRQPMKPNGMHMSIKQLHDKIKNKEIIPTHSSHGYFTDGSFLYEKFRADDVVGDATNLEIKEAEYAPKGTGIFWFE